MKVTTWVLSIQKGCALGVALVLTCLAIGLLFVPGRAARQKENIYTDEQAARGEKLYDQQCASCHGLKLEGIDASPLAGRPFMNTWGDGKHTLDDLFYIVRTQMPYGAAGTLSKQKYIDIIAYILKRNTYPAGDTELPLDPKVLQRIKIGPPPSVHNKPNP